MVESSSSQLRIWEGSFPVTPGAPIVGRGQEAGTPMLRDYAENLATRETLRGPNKTGEVAEPFTLQWFLDIENARHGRQGRWIGPMLEFSRHASETILGLGYGLGTDWVQYARHDSNVVVCCPAADQLALIRRNFELRGLAGKFYHASPAHLPIEGGSIDVACVNGLLHEVPNPQEAVDEVYRVLKPGGKVILVVPARYDVEFWYRHCFPWLLRPKASVALPPGGPWPPPESSRRYHAKLLRQLFARFSEVRISKRHLRRGEVPHLWRWCPLPLLERLMGRLLIFKAFKPLRAVTTDQAAA